MAYLDYGALIKKNGKLLNKDNEFFMDMKDCVNYIDEKIDGDYFCYAGDKDFTIAVYKNIINIFDNGERILDLWGLYDVNEKDLCRKIINIKGVQIDIKRIQNEHDKFRLRMWYKGDLWEIIYGYGISLNINWCYGLNKKSKRYIRKWLEE